jgi:hypothetical protein
MSLWRLRRDSRVIAAAERFEAAPLSRMVKRYVPPERQTRQIATEIAIAKQAIATRWARWKRAAMIAGLIMVCSAAAASYALHRHETVIASARPIEKPRVNLDVLKAVQGVWGWRADSLQSCSENPQTVSVSRDRKTVSVRYAKPLEEGPNPITNLEFDVVQVTPDMLVLRVRGPATPEQPRSTEMSIRFLDPDTITLTHSDDPETFSGSIIRCPSSQPADHNLAH